MLSDQDVLAAALRVVTENEVGLLTTVDVQGVPHARWMGSSVLADGLSSIFTLTGRRSRKLDQVRQNPQVCWVFSSPEFADVVTLHGKAVVHQSPIMVQNVWDRLLPYASPYVIGGDSADPDDDLELVALETTVYRVEYFSPQQHIYKPRIIVPHPAR